MSHPPPFGALLKRYRRAAGLTQEALAERAGYSAVYVGMLERGRRRPQPTTVRFFADALALTARDRVLLEAAAAPAAAPVAPRPDSPSRPAPTRLIGRERELALLERHLGVEGPPVLLLAGEPGIGKTRLLEESARLAPGRAWTTLSGGSPRRGLHDPYAPLLGALEGHLRGTDPEQRRRDLAGCAWLVRLLPELAELGGEPLPSWTVTSAQERRLAFGAVARYLSNVAGPVGTLLLLDDLQWAGADALDLLLSLLRPVAPARAPRVVATYRDTELRLGTSFASALADLAQAGLATRHRLAPLGADETRQLLDTLLGVAKGDQDIWRERVVQSTAGVPFFVVSWAQARSRAVPGDEPHGGVPWDVAESIRQRVAALPAPAGEALRVVAIARLAVPADVLAALVAGSERDVLGALEAARAAGLLAEDEEGPAYRFAHELIREVIEGDMGAAWRVALHRRVAEVLEARPGEAPVEELAYHYGRSTAHDKAARYLEMAGDRALARSAHAAAADHYAALVGCLDSLDRALEAARAREKLAAALSLIARHGAALAPLERAMEDYRAAGDLPGLARVTAALGALHAETGSPEAGIALIRPLLEAMRGGGLTPDAQRAQARLSGALGHLYFFSGRLGEALGAMERAADAARAAGDDAQLALAETGRGNALRMVGRVVEALPVMEDAARLAEAVGVLPVLAGALDNLTWLAVARGEFATAQGHAERALAAARRLGSPPQVAAMAAARGTVAFLSGDWSAARAMLEGAVALQREFDASRLAAYPLAELGRLCLAEGDGAAASGYLEACLAAAERGGDLQALRLAHAALAERDLQAGDPVAARARLLPLLDRPGLEEWQVTELLPILARAQLEAGNFADASASAARAIARGRAHEHRLGLVEALRALGLVAMRQGRWEEAERAVAEALALARAMPYRYGEARALQLMGLIANERGRREHATACLAAALECFRALGARRDAEDIRRVLVAFGGG